MSERDHAQAVPWEAEILRFSAFPAPSVTLEVRPMWEQLVGSAPEEVTERPQQGMRQEIGAFAENHLFVIQQPSRFDLLFGVHPSKVASASEPILVSVGEYERALSNFLPVVMKWIASATALGRIAYGPVLVSPVSGREEGYSVLQRFLPRLPIDPANSQDLFWQINRPRKSTVLPTLTINRLMKFTVIRNQRMDVATAGRQPTVVAGQQISAVRLETDLYSDPLELLPSESVKDLFGELQVIAKEIMERGDIP